MKSFLNRIFGAGVNSVAASLGLLTLRVWLGLTMLINHGWDKMVGFSKMSGEFPEIIPIGSAGNLALAVFAEAVCAALLTMGLLTRFAALMLGITMGVAFFVAHKGALSGAASGELAFIYLAGFTALFLAGPGRFALDASLFSSRGRSG